MGENSTTTEPRLTFKAAGLTNAEATSGATAYQAVAEGVTYRIVGTITPGQTAGRRTFRAYRVAANGRTLTPAAEGGEHKTRKAAVEQIEQVVRELTTPPAPTPSADERLPELHDRVVRRAQYEALKAFLSTLAGWHNSIDDDNDGHFHVDDIRTMINDTARELGTSEPWQRGPDA